MRRSLWPHQEAAIRSCLATLGTRPGYVQMPTGSGKGEIIRQVALNWLNASPKHKVLIAVPNHTLAYQLKAQFLLYGCGNDLPTFLFEGYKLAKASRLIIGTYISLSKIGGHVINQHFRQKQTFFIADECHHVNMNADVNANLAFFYRNRIGFSATPWSEGCAELFHNNLIYAQGLAEAQRAGILCEYEIEIAKPLSIQPGKKWQIYFVEDGARFKQLNLAKSVFYDDYIDRMRPYYNDQVIERFREGAISCIFANRMLLEGFDCHEVKDIYIEKETQSPLLAMQMAGRGFRMFGGQVCKLRLDNATVLDSLKQAINRANQP